MNRLFSLALAAALLCALPACGSSAESAGSISAAAASSGEVLLTEADVLDAYASAAEIYDWFDLSALPYDESNVREADGGVYYRVTDPRAPTLAALTAQMEALFSPDMVESLFAMTPNQYRDFDGALYTAGGARGSNLYLLDKTVSAHQTNERRWTVTLTFYADSYDLDYPSATVGYSQAALHYDQTDAGMRFVDFCSSDGLDLEAETVVTFTYDPTSLSAADFDSYSPLQLALYLLHADGTYAQRPLQLLRLRFANDPEGVLAALAVFSGGPWTQVDAVMDALA